MIRRQSAWANKWWYSCQNYPKCTVTASRDKSSGRMIDYPADKDVKFLRRKAHKLMEECFGKWGEKRAMFAMYSWLKDHVQSGHIGLATKKELLTVIALLKLKLKRTEFLDDIGDKKGLTSQKGGA